MFLTHYRTKGWCDRWRWWRRRERPRVWDMEGEERELW